MKNRFKVDHAERLPDALTVFDKNDEVYAGVQAIKQVTRVFSVYDKLEDYGDLVAYAIINLSPEGKKAVLNLYDLTEIRKALILMDTEMPLDAVESIMYNTVSTQRTAESETITNEK